MSQNDPYDPSQGGQYIPPPPAYQATSDIPPQSPYHYSPAPQQGNRGLLGWLVSAALAVWAVAKYGLLLLVKLPAGGTIISLIVSFGGYALVFGPWFAVALVVMILVHEMGHVVEIRRQGMQATAPIFIPFLGAAIFQRSHPTDALKQAQIGIAGPIAGTLGATAALVLYLSTGWDVLLLAAALGFFLNLLNLIPVWQLDGSWILAPVSKWVYVGGFALVVLAVLSLHSVFLLIIAVFGISSLVQRFRQAESPYYKSVPPRARWALGGAWLALVLYLGVMMAEVLGVFSSLVQ